ncbi:Uncharacterised protein [Chryseobacterium nakagawai]|uniref:hypothetical protein n=1 Tax=Chryseobacterium nakagawai TaxID=1241982 RepID=UPI000F6F055A|nr:hypothetical protein [Chryseobacterium nakagawai]VEH19654.1 Uncharacterised protein [Chryseobacterium nakagawai]
MNVTESIKITNEDNMKLMIRYPDKYFDLAIVDPPYGINAPNLTMGVIQKEKDICSMVVHLLHRRLRKEG